jgi:branched-chain amino acid transport system permease protein
LVTSQSIGIGIATGVALGSLYALVGLSFNLIVATTGFMNFTLESILALGGIGSYLLLNEAGVPVIASIALILVLGAVCGLIVELVAHRPLAGVAKDPHTAMFLVTIGIATAVDALSSKFFGSTLREVNPYVAPKPIFIEGVPIPPSYIVITLVVAVTSLILELGIRYTSIGKQLTATQLDKEGAQLVGIRVTIIVATTFAIASAFAAIAGFLITPITGASAYNGQDLIIAVFAAITIGGLGSFRGALLGGLLVGLTSGLVPLYLPVDSVDPILLLAMIIVLIWRPTGLLGSKQLRTI